jgi:prepilin-type N-terminal cleavage/methylation domain-containing protein
MPSDSFPNKSQRAFTLVEILVVIAIVGLLSSIIFAIIRGTNEQGRIAKGMYFSQHLQNSLGSYSAGIWSFDEGSGITPKDMSGWENHGTLVNGPTWMCAIVDSSYTPSGQGCSLQFDGVNDYVDVGSGDSLDITNAITIEAWIKPNSLAVSDLTQQTIYARSTTYSLLILSYTNGRVYVLQSCNGSSPWNSYYQTPAGVLQVGIWTHIVATYDYSNATVNVYINGDLSTDGSRKTGSNCGIYSSKPTYIGSQAGASRSFNGLIDEVRIYATALTATEIQQHYAEGLERLHVAQK